MADDYLRYLMGAGDEMILSRYLTPMVEYGASWPQHIVEDADLFIKNPSEVLFHSQNPIFVSVHPRTEACGKTDGCNTGCWRIVAGDKLIKKEETGATLGFKKILKFCGNMKAREYKRNWVMEEYRRPSKWDPNQDHVLCKIRLLFQAEINFLLSKQLSYSSSDTLPVQTQSLPAYGVCLDDPQKEGAYYLQKITDSDGNKWPSYVTNDDVYCLHPFALVDPTDDRYNESGICIFANRTDAVGYIDGCEYGFWRIMKDDEPIYSVSHEVMGFKRVFEFCEEDGEEEVFLTSSWIMEEYRLAEEARNDKVLCVIKFRR